MNEWLRKAGAVGVVAAFVFLSVVAREMSIEDRSFRTAAGSGLLGMLFFGGVAVFMALCFPDYFADKASDDDEVWPPPPIPPLSDDETATLLRSANYRDKLEYHASVISVVASATAVIALGVATTNALMALGVSSPAATGAGIGLGASLFCGACVALWRYLKRPVLPDDPKDLERELRHRWRAE